MKCPTKWKRRLTKAEAHKEAARLNQRLGYLAQKAYACGDHWHIGNPRARNHSEKMKRRSKRERGRNYDAMGRPRRK